MKRMIWIALCLVLGTLPAAAADLDMVLAVPTGKLEAGRTLDVTVYVHNTSNETRSVKIPGHLDARLQVSGSPEWVAVTAIGAGGPARVQIGPGRFH